MSLLLLHLLLLRLLHRQLRVRPWLPRRRLLLPLPALLRWWHTLLWSPLLHLRTIPPLRCPAIYRMRLRLFANSPVNSACH